MISNRQIAETLVRQDGTSKVLKAFHLSMDGCEYMIIDLIVTNAICGIRYSFHSDIMEDDEDDTIFVRYTEEVYEELIELLEELEDEDDEFEEAIDNLCYDGEQDFMDLEQPNWSKY